MIDLDVRHIKATPYKAVISNKRVVGIFERRDKKELYIERKNLSAAQLLLIKDLEK